jgi:hypothetical protein
VKLLRLLGWVLIVAIVIASWPWAIFLGCAYGLFCYLRKPQPTRRRVTTGRIAR